MPRIMTLDLVLPRVKKLGILVRRSSQFLAAKGISRYEPTHTRKAWM